MRSSEMGESLSIVSERVEALKTIVQSLAREVGENKVLIVII